MDTSDPLSLQRRLKRTKHINLVIEIAVLLIALDLVFAPLYPAFAHLFSRPVISVEEDNGTIDPISYFAEAAEGVNYLVIPSLGISREIVEATTIKTVHENVWRRPNASDPETGGNTVLVAHRYATIGGNRASTFYSLPDIAIGAKIYVRWEGVIYVYQTATTTTVLPTEIGIEAPTILDQLTLYTCTPLWTATHRFVVVAPLIEVI